MALRITTPLALCVCLCACTWSRNDPADGGDDGTVTESLCVGTPVECDQLTLENCDGQDSCHIAWDCVGVPDSCDAYASEGECLAQSGCGWGEMCWGEEVECDQLDEWSCEAQLGCSIVLEYCVGNAWNCEHLDPGECSIQAGCEWESWGDFCDGDVWSCEEAAGLHEELCEPHDGCHLDEGCVGFVYECDHFISEGECLAQEGCSWKE